MKEHTNCLYKLKMQQRRNKKDLKLCDRDGDGENP